MKPITERLQDISMIRIPEKTGWDEKSYCTNQSETYYQSAVAAYKDGYTDKAMEYIGKGTHYVSDLNGTSCV